MSYFISMSFVWGNRAYWQYKQKAKGDR